MIDFKPGWKKDRPDFRDKVFRAPMRLSPLSLPNSVDHRAKQLEVFDQGSLGSCTANAIGGQLGFLQLVQKYISPFVASRLFIYFNEREMEGNVNEDAGAYIRDGIKSVAAQGVCPESMWPYDISKFKIKPPNRCYEEAMLHQAVEYSRVSQDLHSLKECLANGFCFVFGFIVYRSFMSEETAKTGIAKMPTIWDKLQGALGGHAVMCVGYDDSKQSFIVRNSWGTKWGDKGYFYLPYKYLTSKRLADDFWVIRLTEDIENSRLSAANWETFPAPKLGGLA